MTFHHLLRRIAPVILFVLLHSMAYAVTRTIHLSKPGSLRSLIGKADLTNITSLTLSGDINGADIACLRDMAGQDSQGQLSYLDLADTRIVASNDIYNGGDAYSDRKTEDDVLGSWMFGNCTRLNVLILPSSIVRIDFNACIGCTGLTKIVVPEHVTIIGSGAFRDCTNLSEVQLPKSLTDIKSMAFLHCTHLTTINFPPSLKSILSSAFRKCYALRTIRMSPETSISYYAFAQCPSLRSIYLTADIPQRCDREAFTYDETYQHTPIDAITLYVPKGTTSLYRNSNGWSIFKNIQEYDVAAVRRPRRQSSETVRDCYNLSGQRISPTSKGIRVVRMTDGTVRKVAR